LAAGFEVVETAYAARDTGTTEKEITPGCLPFGANMVVRRDVQVRHPYDPSLGRGPGNMLGCEELAVLNGILNEGGRGYWVPGARVRHFIPRSRQTLSYLWRYCRGNGLSAARLAPNRGRFRLFGSPGWLWKDATASTVRWLLGSITSPPSTWLRDMQTAAWSWGRLQGAWQYQNENLKLLR
jgi:hypothetical protein